MSVQEGSIGVEIVYTVMQEDGTTPQDISSASAAGAKKLVFTKPGSVMTVDAQFVTTGVDGQLKYTTVAAADLTPAGNYRVQAELIMPAFRGRTAADILDVCAHPK